MIIASMKSGIETKGIRISGCNNVTNRRQIWKRWFLSCAKFIIFVRISVFAFRLSLVACSICLNIFMRSGVWTVNSKHTFKANVYEEILTDYYYEMLMINCCLLHNQMEFFSIELIDSNVLPISWLGKWIDIERIEETKRQDIIHRIKTFECRKKACEKCTFILIINITWTHLHISTFIGCCGFG